MKISRRGLFGLGAGAAVVPFVKPAEAKPIRQLIVADDPTLEFKFVQYGAYTDEDGVIHVGVIPDNIIEREKNRIARARLDAVYSKMYGD